MFAKRHVALAASVLLLGGAMPALAQQSDTTGGQGGTPRQVAPEDTLPSSETGTLNPSGSTGGEEVYGEQMMTKIERDAYLDRLKAARDESERGHLRDVHRKAMQQRALERGVTLPGMSPDDVTP